MIRVANAPCSWGVLEFEGTTRSAPYDRVLDEIRDTGYAGTELGDWGFMPTEATALKKAISDRGLHLMAAFVPVALVDASSHKAGTATAVRTARLLRDAGEADAIVVLSDDNGAVLERERNAGRITPELGSATLSGMCSQRALKESPALCETKPDCERPFIRIAAVTWKPLPRLMR